MQQTLDVATLPPNLLLPDGKAPLLVAPLAAPPILSVPGPAPLPPPLGSGVGALAEPVAATGLPPLMSLELANKTFDLIDSNHDGMITQEEWQQVRHVQQM